MLVAIDPGVRRMGVAGFDLKGELLYAFLACGDKWPETIQAVRDWVVDRDDVCDRLVVEKPQVYVQRKLKGDPNDLIDVAVVVGALISSFGFGNFTLYRPHEWKGQVPKEVAVERIKAALSDKELQRLELPAKSYQHNVYDAIGIGLHYLRGNHVRKTKTP